MTATPPPSPSLAPTDPVRTVAIETERYVAGTGWDQPARLFALVPTHELVAAQPELAGPDTDLATLDAGHLSAVEQDGLPDTGDLERALASIAWPDAVVGCALAVERIVVPPEAERDLPDDPDSALTHLQNHPSRQDVRLLAAVHRDGRRICLLRQRAHDRDDMVGSGPDLAGGLVAALAATFDA